MREKVKYLAIGAALVLVGQFVLLNYEYSYLKRAPGASSLATTLSRITGTAPTITIKPFKTIPVRRFLRSTVYYRFFVVELNGGSTGFPKESAIQISTAQGGLYKISGPEIIRPRFADGQPAIKWVDKRYSKTSRTVFVDGPDKNMLARMIACVAIAGKEPSQNCLKAFASSPSTGPLSVSYENETEWPKDSP